MSGSGKKTKILAILLVAAALITTAAVLMPDFRELLVFVLYLILGVVGLIALVLIGGAIWRQFTRKKEEDAPQAIPTYIHDEEERARFREMMGVHEPEPKPLKVVKPDTEEADRR